jgi:hypothetical protein
MDSFAEVIGYTVMALLAAVTVLTVAVAVVDVVWRRITDRWERIEATYHGWKLLRLYHRWYRRKKKWERTVGLLEMDPMWRDFKKWRQVRSEIQMGRREKPAGWDYDLVPLKAQPVAEYSEDYE